MNIISVFVVVKCFSNPFTKIWFSFVVRKLFKKLRRRKTFPRTLSYNYSQIINSQFAIYSQLLRKILNICTQITSFFKIDNNDNDRCSNWSFLTSQKKKERKKEKEKPFNFILISYQVFSTNRYSL